MRYSIDELKAIAAAKGGTLLDDHEYHGTDFPYNWKCVRGHLFKARPNDILHNGLWCKKCNKEDHRAVWLKKCREYARERGGTLLSTEYLSSVKPLIWKCGCGYEWTASFGSMKLRGSWCSKCAHIVPIGLERCQSYAASRGGACLSDKYRNNITKMDWECSRGHRWSACFGVMQNQETWCPSCVKQASKGELRLLDFIRSSFPDAQSRVRGLLSTARFELDIFVPSLNKGIEYDGEYWHSSEESAIRDSKKDREAREAGIQLLRISDSRYSSNPDEVEKEVLAWLGGLNV